MAGAAAKLSETRSPRGSWTIVGLLMAFTFLNYFNRISMSVARDDILDKYNLSEAQFGTILSALILAYAVFMVPGGWLSDLIGGRRALILMGFGTAFFVAVTAALPSLVPYSASALMLWLMWITRAMLGVFTAPLFPAAGRVVSRWIPFAKRARANAWVTGAAMVGIACTYPIFGAMIDNFGLSSAFLIAALFTTGLTVCWMVYARDEPSAARADHDPPAKLVVTTSGANWSEVLPSVSLWLLTISYATVGYVEYLMFYWSDHYFEHVLKFSETESNIAAMIPPLSMGLCMPLGGWLADRLLPVWGYRWSRASVAMFGMFGCAIMFSMGTFVHNGYAVVACFALALAFIGIAEAPAWATAIDLGGESSATSAAIANTGGNLGGMLSPTTSPWISAMLVAHFSLSELDSWAWAIRLGSIVCFAGALLWLVIDASQRVSAAEQ